MKNIEQRLEIIERRAFYKENQVSVLMPTEDGSWRLTVNGKDHFFNSEEEAEAAFRRMTGEDSVLLLWGK